MSGLWLPPSSRAASAQPLFRVPPLRGPHLALVQPEVVRDLVPYCVFDHLFQMFPAAGQPLMGQMENGDLVG